MHTLLKVFFFIIPQALDVIKPGIAVFYISSLLFAHVLVVLAELLKPLWQATRKQHDSDGNYYTLPNAESTEHLYDMETAGQLTLGSELVQVWGRVLGGAEYFLIHSTTVSTHTFGYASLHAYSLTESETHARMSHLITVLFQ